MLNIKLIRSKNYFTGLFISGHAFMSEPGEDIVCASISTLGFTLANYLTEVLKISKEKLDMHAIENEEASILSIRIEDLDIIKDSEVQNGFKFFEVGIISLLEEYSEYIELFYQEV
jgi:uncharacterized protein YsxB (DUF464 family)